MQVKCGGFGRALGRRCGNIAEKAAVAPPDATAVAALGRLLPRRMFMKLKAESLTNDGTALVWDAATGALLATIALPARPPPRPVSGRVEV